MNASCSRRLFLGWVCLLIVGLVASCATAPKIDWASRVGTYTYDQAVLELGPPDKSAELTDGTLIAEWYSRRASGPAFSFGVGTGFSGRSTGVSVGQSVTTTPAPGQLRLTFDRDRKLVTWAGRYP